MLDLDLQGYSYEQIEAMVYDSVVTATCRWCGAEHDVEPDAEGYTCHECGEEEAVTSPLVAIGLI